jgi:hypothetical protein
LPQSQNLLCEFWNVKDKCFCGIETDTKDINYLAQIAAEILAFYASIVTESWKMVGRNAQTICSKKN